MKSNSGSLPRWNEVTAIFGGRFDPPHLGHREAVKGLFQFPAIKQVLILPSATPPHKPALTPMEDRLEMARLNFKPTPQSTYPTEITIHSCEVDRAKKNPHIPTTSFETLEELKPQFPHLAFVIGADQLTQLPTWHRFLDLLVCCHWIVIQRKPENNETTNKNLHQTLSEWQSSQLIRAVSTQTWQLRNSPYRLTLVPTEAPALSSTQIRESLSKNGTPPDGSLLPEVWAYLKQKKLYGINKLHE